MNLPVRVLKSQKLPSAVSFYVGCHQVWLRFGGGSSDLMILIQDVSSTSNNPTKKTSPHLSPDTWVLVNSRCTQVDNQEQPPHHPMAGLCSGLTLHCRWKDKVPWVCGKDTQNCLLQQAKLLWEPDEIRVPGVAVLWLSQNEDKDSYHKHQTFRLDRLLSLAQKCG